MARRLSSHVLCITIVLLPPIKILELYSSIALKNKNKFIKILSLGIKIWFIKAIYLLESFTWGTYLITTQWSGCSPSLYKRPFDITMSSTTVDLEISLERNCWGAERFLPSLLPRWLYDTIDSTLIPADTRKSTSTDL